MSWDERDPPYTSPHHSSTTRPVPAPPDGETKEVIALPGVRPQPKVATFPPAPAMAPNGRLAAYGQTEHEHAPTMTAPTMPTVPDGSRVTLHSRTVTEQRVTIDRTTTGPSTRRRRSSEPTASVILRTITGLIASLLATVSLGCGLYGVVVNDLLLMGFSTAFFFATGFAARDALMSRSFDD